MRHIALAATLLAVLTLAGLAQSPLGEITPGTYTGSIRGRVLAAGTDAPLRHARVQTVTAVGRVPVVFTDAEGRFEIPSLAKGAYRLWASKPGFVATRTGARRPADAGTPVTVVDGPVDGVDLRLPPAGAVLGRILDATGDPALGVPVTALMHPTNDADPALVAAASTSTDDRGEYRLGGLPEGDVIVAIDVGPRILGPEGDPLPPGARWTSSASGRVVTVSADALLTREYYPGVTAVGDAHVVTLSAGEERASIDFLVPSYMPKVLTDLMARDAPAKPDPPTAVIRGRITRPDGRPLPHAMVRLPGGFPPPSALADDNGRYELLHVPPGRYRVMASRPGWISAAYGQRRPSDPGDVVELEAGDVRDRIDITLPDSATIVGRIVDDRDEVVEGADVRVLQVRYESGRRRLVDVANVVPRRTDDRGAYRVSGLPAGDYIVRALVGQVVPGLEPTLDLSGYAPTYFPGSWKPDEARAVTVSPAQQFTDVDFALARVPMARITGRGFNAEGQPIQGNLALTPSRRSGSVAGMSVGAQIKADGTFEFSNVTPGEYVLQAWKPRPNPWTEGEFASQFVSVNASDITGLLIRMAPGSTIRGRVTLEGAGTLQPGEIDLSPIPVDADLSPLVGNPPARAAIRPDGTFELAGISGPRRLTLMRAPAGWTLKQVLRNGIDVTDAAMPFGGNDQSVQDVEVILTTNGGEVSGRVSDGHGQWLTDYTVVIVAIDRDRWFLESRFLKQSRPGADGVFAVRGLPSGEYAVAAVDRLRADEWADPDVLESITAGALRVTIEEGQKLSVTPKLLSR